MEAITAYRKRVGRLTELADTLKASHEQLFDLRSQSWREQLEGDASRHQRLADLAQRIADLEAKIDGLRGELGLRRASEPDEIDQPG